MVARFWEHDFYAVWPTKRSRAAHLFVRGAGAKDASLCGLAEEGAESKPATRNDLICTRCHYKARHWDHTSEPPKPKRKVVKNKPQTKAARPKRKPLPMLKPPKNYKWDEIEPGMVIAGCRVVAKDDRYIMLEEAPTTHLYLFQGKRQYLLHTPWLYYYIMRDTSYYEHFRIYRLFCSPKKVTALNQALFKMPLPNQYQWGLCYNGSANRLPASQGIADAITIWWNQTANWDNFPKRHKSVTELREAAKMEPLDTIFNVSIFDAWERMGTKARKLSWAETKTNIAKLFPKAKKKDLDAAAA
jgi:hypothetical protein